jgi:hypothetical protein
MGAMLQQDRCTQNDYVRLFADSAEPLRWLCYTLTGNEELSEKVLRAAFEQSLKGADCVFRDWMASWARRLIIQACIALMRPTGCGRKNVPVCIPEKMAVEFQTGWSLRSVNRLMRSSRGSCILIRCLDSLSCCGHSKDIRAARLRFCLRSATEHASPSLPGRWRLFSPGCTFSVPPRWVRS